MKKIVYSITNEEEGGRLDSVLADKNDALTRSQISKLINAGSVQVNSSDVKTSYRVREGDVVVIEAEAPKQLSAASQNIPLDIIYEDRDIIVVNKVPGMVVHPAPGNPDRTLVNALLHHCKDLSGIGGVLRPGIVHRLDKGTSGVILVAKNDAAHLNLSKQFKNRELKKVYFALVYGVPGKRKGEFSDPIGRHRKDRKRMSIASRKPRNALTRWELIKNYDRDSSLLRINLLTGRTHQIRVHFSSHHLPLVGDDLYGSKKPVKRLRSGGVKSLIDDIRRPMLHAYSISVIHPTTEKKMTFKARLSEDFREVLNELRSFY